MATSSDTLKITFGAGNAYTFKGQDTTQHRVHSRGHIWLSDDNPNFTITFAAQGGYTFDPAKPIYLGPNPAPKQFDDCNNQFGYTFDPKKPAKLQLTSQNNDGGKYFYLLNFLDLQGNSFPIADPIIVNR